MKKYFYLLSMMFLVSNFSTKIQAQADGTLDTSFGTGGYSIVNVKQGKTDLSEDVWVYPDGKILMLGKVRQNGSYYSVCLVRLLADGTLDNSFGNQGIVVTTASNESSFGISLSVQQDNKIVVAGYAMGNQHNMMAIRYNDDGSLDTSFGDSGIKTVVIENKTGIAEAIAIQNDNKIVIGGYASGDRFALVRFNTDGSLDSSFGNNGYTLYEPEILCFIKSIDIQADGKIVAGGIGYLAGSPAFMVVRFNTDGSVDDTFGDSGKVKMHVGYGNDFANKIKILSNGNILVGGHTWIANAPILQYDLALVMLKSDGKLDSSFGNSGITKTHIIDAENYLFDIDIDENNRIVASGYATDDSGSKMIVARYRADGELDTEFGGSNTGYNLLDLPNANLYSTGMSFQHQTGKLILGGYVYVSGEFNFCATRLNGSNVGTDDIINNEKTFTIWPNPVKDKLFVKSNMNLSKTSYYIYDVNGKIVKKSNFAENNNFILCDDLKKGVYFLKINEGKKEQIHKFIKK